MSLSVLHYLMAGLGAAVVTVLVVLVLEIKKSNRLKRANMTVTLRRQFMDLQSILARNEDLASLYNRGLHGFTGLSETEQTRFFIVAGYAFTHWSEVARLARSGLISNRYWNEVQNQLRDFLQYPGVQEFWAYRKHWYAPEYQALVADLMKDTPKRVKPLYPEPSV